MSDKSLKILVALAGQPNSGKSTIFNILTGARQHVANYPGVTVEKKSGSFSYNKNERVELVDLPGTHSLTSYTLEERIARDFLLNDKPAAVVDVLDASNLERNLYLTFQLAEMNIPLVIDLNMIDVAEKRGIKIDTQKLSQELGIPVVSTVGNKGKGKRRLKEAIMSASKKGQATPYRIDYGDALESIIDFLGKRLSEEMEIFSRYPVRWLAVKLMENDEEAQRLVRKYSQKSGVILKLAEEKREAFKLEHKKSPQKVIAITRHQEAERIVEASVTRSKEISRTLTDRIDQVACNRYLGPVVLATTIYLIYELAIVQGYKITEYTWPLLAWSRDLIASLLPSEGFIFDPFFRSMPIWAIVPSIT
ncbi:MAG: ferrous iron transporter B, partial [Thermodesulfobacteriota bacterium]|nr:ferrous iron transporter B [Thermodesulfobacteriota bacterium]